MPARAYEAGGHRFLQFEDRRQMSSRTTRRFEPDRVVTFTRTCEATFDIVADRVVSYAIRGNACDWAVL